MIKKINLSQRPFHNRKLFWMVCGGIMCGFWWMGQGLWASIADTRSIVTRIEQSVAKEKSALEQLRGAFPTGEIKLNADEIRKVQAAAWLIEQRGFSWTGLLEDLEQEFPEGVRLVNVGLRDNRDNAANSRSNKPDTTKPSNVLSLRVQVIARSVDELLKMVKAADKRGVFRFEPRVQDVADTGEYSFALDADYRLTAPNARQPRNDDFARSEEE
jgi:hypothetical protein